jgi:cysteine synthase A
MTEATAKKETKSAPVPKNLGAPRGRVYDSVLQTIGGTPLVRLPNLTKKHGLGAHLMAKLEFFGPTASVKDRSVLAMVEGAEVAGQIKPGKSILIEATAGNAAVSIAQIGAVKGYRVILVMPESTALEKQKFLRLLGAELILVPPEKGMKGAAQVVKNTMKESKDYFSLNQFENTAAIDAHANGTAQEIWADTGGAVDVFIAGVGTGATIMGTAQTLKKHKPGLQVFAVEPAESAVLSGEKKPEAHGIHGLGAGHKPELLDMKLIDGVIKVSTDQALKAARELARVEGIAGGISSGANIAASIEVAKMPDMKGKNIVTIIPSFAERYISSKLFDGMGKG